MFDLMFMSVVIKNQVKVLCIASSKYNRFEKEIETFISAFAGEMYNYL